MKKLLIAITVIAITTLGVQAQKGNWNSNRIQSPVSGGLNQQIYTDAYQYNTASYGQTSQAQFAVPGVTAVNNYEMTFVARGIMNVEAVSYLAIFNMKQIAETASETDELWNERYNAFKAELESNGVDYESIVVDMVSLTPRYEIEIEKKLFSKTYTEVPKGFELQKNIHIKFQEEELLDWIVTIAARHEIYDLVKVDYFVENAEAIFDTLRNQTVELMNTKTESFADLDIDFDEFTKVAGEQMNVVYPIDRYSKYQESGSQSFEAIKKRQGVTQASKAQTMFYDIVPYNSFEIVINPQYDEPVVQFAYTLTVKYTRKPVETETPKTQYIWMTPDGQLRNVNVE